MAITLRLLRPVAFLRAVIENIDKIYDDVYALLYRREHEALTFGSIGNGGTNGRLRTSAVAVTYRIGGTLYTKASTDDLWNLSGETATGGTAYRAYWLYLDSSGTASIAASTGTTTTADAAIAALPAVTSTKAVIGCYVAAPSTNFANALAAQGTIYNGWPTAQTLTSDSISIVKA